jgi:predicted transcriptional regulator of viral defense system
MENFPALSALMDQYSSFTFGTANRFGVSRYQLNRAIDQGILDKSETGIYVKAGYFEDEMSIISQRFSRGIFDRESALIYYDLSDEMPFRYTMTFPRGYHPTAQSLKKHFIKKAQYRTGRYYSAEITTQLTDFGNKIQIYSLERSLLDAWNSETTQLYTKNDAVKRYAERPDGDYNKLLKLERELYPRSTLSKILEVLVQ